MKINTAFLEKFHPMLNDKFEKNVGSVASSVKGVKSALDLLEREGY